MGKYLEDAIRIAGDDIIAFKEIAFGGRRIVRNTPRPAGNRRGFPGRFSGSGRDFHGRRAHCEGSFLEDLGGCLLLMGALGCGALDQRGSRGKQDSYEAGVGPVVKKQTDPLLH